MSTSLVAYWVVPLPFGWNCLQD
uniref:Uncharacterized protein n=1 Tax=Anguilla anguilla TaxID=7936 RepID=A0A0E9RXS8_ANGAN